MPNRVAKQTLRLRSQLLGRARGWQRRQQPNLPPNAAPITPQLVVGGFIDADDWRNLVAQGVTTVVSLQGERHDEDAFGDLQPTGYLRLPTVDFSPPTHAQLHMGAAFIDAAIRAGEKVLVHCHAGVGRSTMQCAAYLIMTGMSLDEAWDLIKEKRPNAMWNERQQAAMKQFAKEIEAERSTTSEPISGPVAQPDPFATDITASAVAHAE